MSPSAILSSFRFGDAKCYGQDIVCNGLLLQFRAQCSLDTSVSGIGMQQHAERPTPFTVLSIIYLVGHVMESPTLGNPIFVPAISVALATNMTSTVLISLRLWIQNRRIAALNPTNSSQYSFIVTVVVESAAIYTAISLCQLVTVVLDDSTQFLFIYAFCESSVRGFYLTVESSLLTSVPTR